MRPVTIALAVAGLLAATSAFAECPGNPNAVGLSRTVEIDTTGGPGFGFEQYRMHDFLMNKEVVLTFDDGPWPENTRAVLNALDEHCVKATFFIIGKHAIWHPDILKDVAARGHTIGTHTWSHANLRKMKPEKAKEEIEKGLSAVKVALGGNPAPFFRFPYLQDPNELVTYLGSRNIAIFSHDVDSFDFKHRKPEVMVKALMAKLEKKGKGIILMHDFQKVTAKAMPMLLNELAAKGYKVVHMVPKAPATTMPEYDQLAQAEVKGPVGSGRPTSSVVKTISAGPTQ
ncbi:MAG: oligosaccharide deacetylase [Proteobacteria bacterium]|jgi:Predicted xylanase/chitin deacetylase|nr:MAG: oligosaccharide deacetylase [Pseudomonadota bacterium]